MRSLLRRTVRRAATGPVLCFTCYSTRCILNTCSVHRLATSLAMAAPSRSSTTGSDIAALVNVIRAEENKVHIDIGAKVEVRSISTRCCVVAAYT